MNSVPVGGVFPEPLNALCFEISLNEPYVSTHLFTLQSGARYLLSYFPNFSWERDVAQLIACPPLKRSVVGSILLSGPSCSLGYFPFQPVVHNWFIKGRGMYCSVYGKVHIKDPLLLIEKSSLCGGSVQLVNSTVHSLCICIFNVKAF